MNKTNFLILIVLFIIFGIIGLLIVLFSSNEKNDINSTQYSYLSAVNDESIFFSVSSNINKLYEYIQLDDLSSAYNLLDKSYIETNNISYQNLLEKLNLEYGSVSFSARQMYVISNKNQYKYLVKGYIKKDTMDVATEIINTSYCILNYDVENGGFSIELITESKYLELIKNRKINFDDFFVNINNQFEYVNISESSLASLYFNDFMNDLFANPTYAYECLSTETKENYFNTYDEFLTEINNNLEYYSSIRYTGYNISNNEYKYIDNYNNEYVFTVNNVMNYTVDIKFKDSQE